MLRLDGGFQNQDGAIVKALVVNDHGWREADSRIFCCRKSCIIHSSMISDNSIVASTYSPLLSGDALGQSTSHRPFILLLPRQLVLSSSGCLTMLSKPPTPEVNSEHLTR